MSEQLRDMPEKKRLKEKFHQPTEEFVQMFLGADAWELLQRLEEMLRARYVLSREMKFPFGNEYGWGFRYAHKKALLLYVFFEEGGFCCTISISDKGAPKVAAMLDELLPEIQAAWANRYACGADGGWIHYSVSNGAELADLVRLVGVKVRPARQ